MLYNQNRIGANDTLMDVEGFTAELCALRVVAKSGKQCMMGVFTAVM